MNTEYLDGDEVPPSHQKKVKNETVEEQPQLTKRLQNSPQITNKIKISTKDCVSEILKQEQGNWKRISKNKQLTPRSPTRYKYNEDSYLREFKNKDNNRLAFVYATDTEIRKVEITEPVTVTEYISIKEMEPLDNPIKTIESYLRGIWDDNTLSTDSQSDIIASTYIANMDEDLCRQDFENFQINKAENYAITISHNGYMQVPIQANYRTMKNGLLYLDFENIKVGTYEVNES